MDEALRMFGTQEQALNHLLEQPDANAVVASENPLVPSLSTSGLDAGQGLGMSLEEDGEGPSAMQEVKDRDAEMEDELTGELLKGDAYSDYDIDVTLEGEAINEYLAKLAG